jgi:signal transduction histidine kinase
MTWTAQQRIRTGFALLLFVPVILGLLVYQNAKDLIDESRKLAISNDINRRLEKVFSLLKDVEVAQREYILVGGEQPIETIQTRHAEIDTEIAELRKDGADDHWLTLLEIVIPQKFEEIQTTIDLRAQGGPEAASEVLLAHPGTKAMDDIRVIVSNLIKEQMRKRNQQTHEQRRSFYRAIALVWAVLIVNLALIGSLYRFQRSESERARKLNEELELRVASRTEALQRSNEDLLQFAYVASHDMKEPMRMISSYTTLLQRRLGDHLDPEAETFMGFIVDGVKRMNTFIQDLLEYSQAGAGKDDQLADVEIEPVLRNVLANLKVTVAESRASVTWSNLPATVPYDAVRLTQVFQNLIGNALKYRGERPPIVRVACQLQGDEYRFSVSDNGIGIAPEYVERIFGIFQRLHGKEFEGTGIGLAMVKRIIERYGGRIWVDSTPGEGSTFSFTVLRTTPVPASEAMSTTTTS